MLRYVSAIALGGVVLAPVAAADRSGVGAGLKIEVRSDGPWWSGRPVRVEARELRNEVTDIAVEADGFPFDGRWERLRSGRVGPGKTLVLRHKPQLNTRYRVVVPDTDRSAEVTLPVSLRQGQIRYCDKQDDRFALRTCRITVRVYGPKEIEGRRVEVLAVREGHVRPTARKVGRLRHEAGRRYGFRVSVRVNYFDDITVCMLGAKTDGFQNRDTPAGEKDDAVDCLFLDRV